MNAFSTRSTNANLITILLITAISLAGMFLSRPLLPVDETRYMSVAWEMWLRNDFLVPYLNGETYSHKPPLLFWLFHLGWKLFGVNEWWPRLLPSILSLMNLFLIAKIAKRLWPEKPNLPTLAALVLSAMSVWMVFSTLVMFEMLLTTFVLSGLLSALYFKETNKKAAWFGIALSIAGGLLTKGPVILIHLSLVLIMLPLVFPSSRTLSNRDWYKGIIFASLTGILMAGLWAIPAGISGGESYRNAIFWGQTAGRVVDSFAHKQPFWWYIPIIPLAIIPWIFLPRPIGGLFSIHRYWNQFGIRFLSIWILVVLIALSVISGKQIKYLVPLLPAVALLFAFVLNHQNEKSPSLFAGLKTPLAIFLGLGGLLSLLPFLPLAKYQALLALLDWRWGLGLLLSLATLLLTKKVVGFTATQYVGLASAISFFFVQMAILNPLAPAYDLHRVGAALKQLQSTGHKIAYLGTYHDQFHFLGRLEQPLVPITSPEAQSWIQDNPNQYIIVYYDEWDHKLAPEQPYYFQPYRSSILAIWNTSQLQRGSNYNWPLKDAKKESSSPD